MKAAKDLGNEAAQKEIHKYAGQIGSAILIACKEVFGAGIGRMSKFTEVLNDHLPDCYNSRLILTISSRKKLE